MRDRINILKLEPNAYEAMFAIKNYMDSLELGSTIKHLIKIRASQLNGCAFCLQMHTKEARNNGEDDNRMHALNAWRDSPLFTESERAALAVTEEITELGKHGLSNENYERALDLLGENGLAQCIMQAVEINMWNRIAVATRMKHGEV